MPYVAPTTKSANTVLTSAEWNTIVGDIVDLNGRIQNLTTTQRIALTPAVGDLVYDSTQKVLYIWGLGGSFWSGFGNIVTCSSTTRPSTPTTGQLIYETNSNKVLRYEANALSQWIDVSSGHPIYNNSQLSAILSTYGNPALGTTVHDSSFNQDKRYIQTVGGNAYVPTGNYFSAAYANRPTPTVGMLFYQTDTDELLKYVTDLDSTQRWMQADHDYRRNFVVNGGFDVWQRGVSFNPASSTTTTGANYGADRWQMIQATSNSQAYAQFAATATDPAGFNYYARVQRVSAATFTTPFTLQTSFESRNIQNVRGKYLTLSFWARAGANYSAASGFLVSDIVTGTGTDNTVGNFTGNAVNTTANNVLTTSWKRFSITTSAVLATTITQLGVRFVFTPVGTAGAADYYDITGVQLETGTAPSDFEYRDAGEELSRCQRYYYRIWGETAVQGPLGPGMCTSTTGGTVIVKFPTTMRKSPTVLDGFTSSTYRVLNSAGSAIACTSGPTFVSATPDSSTFSFGVASGLVAGDATIFTTSGSGFTYLAWPAEL
jgi:hypothetical protein